MSLEIQQGFAVLYIDYGTGTARLDQKQIKLTDGKSHRIDIYWNKSVRNFVIHAFCLIKYINYFNVLFFQLIELIIDNCRTFMCTSLKPPRGFNEFLNVNSPMQVGGTLTNLSHLASNLGWDYKPTDKGFVGCIRNMTFNGNVSNKEIS